MISIVVPTMWRHLPVLDFIGYLSRTDVVNEIIIIDNNSNNRPAHPVLNNPKIKLLDFGKNIFVNPAWNVGVKHSTSDIVCFLNDDLIFDMIALYKVADFMKPETGAIGVSKGDSVEGHPPILTGEIEFTPFVGQNCYGFGELMFVHKAHWIDIPDGLDIGFGDAFIFERYLFNGFQNYFLTDLFHYHKGSTTMNSLDLGLRLDVFAKEQKIYDVIKQKMLDGSFFQSATHI